MHASSKTGNWDGLRKKLKELIEEKVASGRLALPPMQSTARKVVQSLESGASFERAAELLESDPTLALEVLRLANSATFAQRGRVTSLVQAATTLGTARLRSLMLTAAAQSLFTSRNRVIRKMTGALWAHSVAVAVTARQIAVRSGFPDKEGPYLAGLMHDIGKPVVAVHLLELERSVSRGQQDTWIDPSAWLSLIDELHRPVGLAVAKHWHLSEDVCKVIADPSEFDAIDRMSAANAARFANALAKREGVYAGHHDPDQVDAVLMIGRSMLALDDAAIASLAHTLKERAQSMEEAQ